METLQSTLEMIDLSADNVEKMDSFENELLADDGAAKNPPADNKELKSGAESLSELDHRLHQMEFQILEGRIKDLVDHKVPFGKSGLMASAVVAKDLTPSEIQQLQSNAVNISAIINSIKEKLADPIYMGLATLTLVTDDLYQENSFKS